jgi:hypothetical protein
MQHDPDLASDVDAERDRATERRAFSLTTTLSGLLDGKVTARVRNLSAGGMMIELPEEPDSDTEPGQRVTAQLRNIGRVKGEIAWAAGKRIGVRFDREIDPEAARKPVVAGEGTPDYLKPVLIPGRSLKNIKSLKGW